MPKTGKPYTIVVHEGEELRQYENGTIRDERGRIRVLNVGREMALKRFYGGKEAAAEALRKHFDAESSEEAWAKLIAKKIALAEGNTRDSIEATKLIGRATGHLDDGTIPRSEEVRAPEIKWEMPKEIQEIMLKIAQREYERDIIDSTFVEDENENTDRD